MSLPHWEYFLALDSDLAKCARYVEPVEDNYSTYSIEFARLILTAGSEIDVVAKELCEEIGEKLEKETIGEYCKVIKGKYPKITNCVASIPRWEINNWKPWKDWRPKKSPSWWEVYQDVKHHRESNYSEANLCNSIMCLMGLFVMLLFYYKEKYDEIKHMGVYPGLIRPKGLGTSPGGYLYLKYNLDC
ncbi:MAG: hypothetical protein PVG03_14630 [Desulfarculaceae bacterium]|jgi:hypothetical protein